MTIIRLCNAARHGDRRSKRPAQDAQLGVCDDAGHARDLSREEAEELA